MISYILTCHSKQIVIIVLILVVVEDDLVPVFLKIASSKERKVLILVVVEDDLVLSELS